jgi:hypothetical protein
VDYNFISRALEHPFFELPPPKSLDRNDFAFGKSGLPEYSVPDGAATLSALTVEAVARVLRSRLWRCARCADCRSRSRRRAARRSRWPVECSPSPNGDRPFFWIPSSRLLRAPE